MARRTVTEELFTSCKSLQAQGSSVYSAAQALKISDVTVRRIFKAGSLAEYKVLLKDWNHTCDKPEKQEQKRDQATAPVTVIPISELSAKDKKELAMYAIDQHYFFLKQLTGVV